VTAHIVELVVANALFAAFGTGLLPLLRLAQTRRQLLTRLPLGYAVGLAAGGIVVAHLSLLHVPVGRAGLPLLAIGSLVLGLRRLPPARAGSRVPWRPEDVAAVALLGVAAVVAIQAARLFAVKPLLESDGWVIWATRARTLYEFGHPAAPVFTDASFPALQYPLLLPGLEAVAFRFMGGFDGTLVHLQLLAIAVAFVGGAWTLLREQAPPVLLAATLLAIATAPSFFVQLQTNYADIPLAMLIALGVASLAAWLRSGGAGLLPAAALFLGAGALTKNEGELFALAAYVVAFLVARRPQRRPLAWAALATLAIELPWRIWVQVHGLKTADYSLANLFDPGYLNEHRDRVGPSASELLTQIGRIESWSYLVPLIVVGLAGALLLRRFRLAAFGAGWAVFSFAGLLAIYWISRNPVSSNLFNTSDRTIDTLLLGCALLVPVLLAPEREPEPGKL
jgi:dolichyl-phosphate-mannose-protein mannosyltransferase